MDPNTRLEELRDLAMMVALSGGDMDRTAPYPQAAIDLAEKFEELDKWITKGGFLPAQWQQGK